MREKGAAVAEKFEPEGEDFEGSEAQARAAGAVAAEQ